MLDSRNWHDTVNQLYFNKNIYKSPKIKTELHYEPEIPFLGIYPEKTLIWKDTCTSLFRAALFTIDKTWKQPKHSSMAKWIRKIWDIYIYIWVITYSAIKKNEILPFAAIWVDLANSILNKVNQTKTNIVSLIHEILKIIQTNLYTKQKQTHRHRKQTYCDQKGKRGREKV